ncbi:hypothetical protein [Methanothermococcus sp.]|nr:hypothetical protein [Methanothermococcus sp.]
MDLENSFLNAISESFKAYNEYGARSNKKLIPYINGLQKLLKIN